jgi:hypothetical protein
MRKRLAPFLVLLEARYAPLLFAVAPQAYAVYLWLWRGSDLSSASFAFAVMGGIGYEFVYVGAIAWAEEGRSSAWTWLTAVVALLFSVAVAYYVYSAQGAWAWLHAGFPLVAFAYTLNMYGSARAQEHKRPSSAHETALETLPERFRSPEDGAVDTLADLLNLSAPVANAQNSRLVLSAALNGASGGSLGPSEALEATVAVAQVPSAYACPHCSAALKSKQARGAAVANGHCPACRPGRINE